MSWLEQRSSGCFHVVFRLGDRKFKRSLKTRSQSRAEGVRLRLDENLRLVEQGRLPLPEGGDIVSFLLSDGKLNGKPVIPTTVTLETLFKEYLASLPEGCMEANSLYTAKIHMKHFERILGKRFPSRDLKQGDLQEYVRRRGTETGRRKKRISPATIRKELSTFSAVWSWARTTGRVEAPFPNKGLKYPKTTEKPPFQTRHEIEQQLSHGGLSEREQEELWDCLYLTLKDIEAVLELVRNAAGDSVLHPMCVMAAHTGARRSEILRAQVNDIDFNRNVVLLREKKRKKGTRTTRIVPLSSSLATVIREWMKNHPRCKMLFFQKTAAASDGREEVPYCPVSVDQATDLLRRVLDGTEWKHIRGWHVFRHSFISNCAAKGIDQRIIDAWSGHQTEEMRRRYTHLLPNCQQDAMQRLFGGSVRG